MIQALVSHGADLNVTCFESRMKLSMVMRPVHCAAHNGHWDVVAKLLRIGAPFDEGLITRRGAPWFLQLVALQSRIDILHILLQSGGRSTLMIMENADTLYPLCVLLAKSGTRRANNHNNNNNNKHTHNHNNTEDPGLEDALEAPLGHGRLLAEGAGSAMSGHVGWEPSRSAPPLPPLRQKTSCAASKPCPAGASEARRCV